jgi:steroid 5-alpha reductase family enzyme
MGFLEAYLVGAAVTLGLMVALWLVSLPLRDSSIVDVFWGVGFVVLAWLYFGLTPEGPVARKLLLSVLVTVWGLRLALHILRRNWGRGEDYRYRRWREEAGDAWWWRSFFKVFLLQGVLLWVISAPLLGAQVAGGPEALGPLDYLAAIVWGVGFVFEAGGDWQLSRFKANPANRGRVLDSGLWRYTRHPNYFGDATQWWGFYLFSLAAGVWWTVFSPVLMTVLLLRVSGVALLEKDLKDSKPGYREYVESTSAFVPMPPRRRRSGTQV